MGDHLGAICRTRTPIVRRANLVLIFLNLCSFVAQIRSSSEKSHPTPASNDPRQRPVDEFDQPEQPARPTMGLGAGCLAHCRLVPVRPSARWRRGVVALPNELGPGEPPIMAGGSLRLLRSLRPSVAVGKNLEKPGTMAAPITMV